MGWLNYSFTGNNGVQSDDAETATVLETGDKTFTLPNDITIVDVVADKTATETHEFRFFVNGRAQGSQFFSSQINPATQGRLNFANQNIKIPKGSNVQIRGAQKTNTGAAAEAIKVLVQFVP